MTPDDVLDRLDPEQREAVLVLDGPVCVLAGAGTGKTRTITHRIAYGVRSGRRQPQHLLAVTFTARAAGELRARLRGLGVDRVQARTFHAAALRQLSYFWPRVVGGEFPQLAETKFALVGTAAARARLRLTPAEVRDLAGEIEWAKSRLVVPSHYPAAVAAAGRTPPRDPFEVAEVFAAYEQAKQRAGLVDFDDLLLLTAAAIEEHEDVADEVRARYRHFVVDEYQDVSPLQQRLLDAWLGDRDDLCVVGDDDQTIYSFAGAARSYLLDFPRRYPAAAVVRLVRDYRSTPQVVGLANRVIAPGRGGAGKRLVAQRPDGPEPAFAQHDDEPAEARWVVARIRSLLDAGVPAAEIAVLYRVNAQSEVYEAALAAAGVPYVVRGGERFFERREVREALAVLRTAAAGPGAAEPVAVVSGVRAGRLGWDAAAPPDGGVARDRWEALAALAGLAAEPGAGPTLGEFVAELEQRAADQHVPAVAGVTLASLHAAKGLEWDAVFLVGLVDGTLPIQHAVTPDAVDEERRLLSVGVTRARSHVHLSWALARAAGGRRARKPSRFLDGLVPAAAAGRPAPVPKQRADPTVDLDDEGRELFDRMRAWRRETADALDLPAFCVFSDATLRAIASARPADRDALRAISGVGPTKLDKFGEDVLALVSSS